METLKIMYNNVLLILGVLVAKMRRKIGTLSKCRK